jgi:hypothetical protein
MSVTRYLLTLTACVLLALPTGWCCLFAVTRPSTSPDAAQDDADCCRSCCTKPKPVREEAPARAPVTWCCCENLVSIRDDGGAKVVPDVAVLAMAVVEAPPISDHFHTRPAEVCLSPPRPLHVLRCLWLC